MAARQSHYAKLVSPWLDPILGHKAGALTAHWLFQGMLQMDASERWFKLGLDALGTTALTPLMRRVLPLPLALSTAALATHTLNFLLNGQVYGVLKHYGGVSRTRQEFDAYVAAMQGRIAHQPAVVYAAAYGSLARGKWSPTSDLDVRLVRAAGLVNAWRACWFALAERARAFYHRFPLDLLVLDDCDSLESMAEKDTPVVLAELPAERRA